MSIALLSDQPNLLPLSGSMRDLQCADDLPLLQLELLPGERLLLSVRAVLFDMHWINSS